jgi:hypothetical protein
MGAAGLFFINFPPVADSKYDYISIQNHINNSVIPDTIFSQTGELAFQDRKRRGMP